MRLAAVALTVILTLAGCGSGSSEPEYGSASQVAGKIGCAAYGPQEPMIGAAQSGDCTLDGADLIVSWFDSDKGFDSYKEAAELMAGAPGASTLLIGDNWSVECTEAAACEKAKTDLGGKVQ